jgi:cell division protein FtsQ
VKIQTKINNRSFLFLILFSTSFISLATIKKVNIQDIRISGSKLLTHNDVANISTLKFPTRLIFIQTNLLEKELRQNLSLKNVSVSRQIFPFGLKVQVETRTPIAYGERILNGQKISGFIDKDGIFINKQNVEEIELSSLNIQIFGWKERFKETLSEILIARDNYEFEIVKITFSPNGFLTLEEKNLKKIFLGFNPNLINYQLQIINDLKIQFKKNNFYEKIDSIDITDPNKPKIKVFKP